MQLQTVIADAASFLMVSEATATLIDHPDITFSGGAILVNTEHIIAFNDTQPGVTTSGLKPILPPKGDLRPSPTG
jgi:hypothetical protein